MIFSSLPIKRFFQSKWAKLNNSYIEKEVESKGHTATKCGRRLRACRGSVISIKIYNLCGGVTTEDAEVRRAFLFFSAFLSELCG
jgi:hypothetical protein